MFVFSMISEFVGYFLFLTADCKGFIHLLGAREKCVRLYFCGLLIFAYVFVCDVYKLRL